jgi:alpha-beta hydrolase superfamily lysophospholipase
VARRFGRRIALGLLAAVLCAGVAAVVVVAPRLPAIRMLRRMSGPLPDAAELARAGARRTGPVAGSSADGPGLLELPGPSADAPIVIAVAGVTAQGIDDPSVGRLALELRAAGCRVVAPEIPGLSRLGEGGDVLDALVRSWADASASGTRPVAFLGVSLGAGLVLRALARGAPGDPDPRSVSAVLLIGPADDVLALARAWFARPVAGQGVDAREEARSDAGTFARHGIARAALDATVPASDRAALRAWIDGIGEDPASGVPGPVGLSSPEAARWVATVRAEAGLAADDLRWLIDAARPFLEATSPAATDPAALARIRAPVFLLHGEEDPMIPCSESLRLAARLGGAATVETLRSRVLAHVEVASPGLAEAWRHVTFVQRFLDAAGARR